jgi:hypothetical protein
MRAAHDPQAELVRLVRRIQVLTLELKELQTRTGDGPELDAKGRDLGQLRWRLAKVAQRTATNDLDAAA